MVPSQILIGISTGRRWLQPAMKEALRCSFTAGSFHEYASSKSWERLVTNDFSDLERRNLRNMKHIFGEASKHQL